MTNHLFIFIALVIGVGLGWVVCAKILRKDGRRTAMDGYLYVDASDPEIDNGGGVYLHIFESPKGFGEGKKLTLEVIRISQEKQST